MWMTHLYRPTAVFGVFVVYRCSRCLFVDVLDVLVYSYGKRLCTSIDVDQLCVMVSISLCIAVDDTCPLICVHCPLFALCVLMFMILVCRFG